MQQTSVNAAPPSVTVSRKPRTPEAGKRINFGERVYNEISDFLIEEAWLLDEDLFRDWLGLLAEDVLYTMPVRQTMYRRSGKGFQASMNWFYEDLTSLQFKVARMETDSAFAEDPPSRVRRLISNVRVHETSTPGEYLVQSYILLRRNRGDAYASDSISARRDDLIRHTDGGWKLAQRTILMDQAVLGTPNLAVFL